MEYIKNEDYEYIKNKYHDTAKPFDTFSRFICHEEIFDESTGMSPKDIIDGIWENDKKYENMPHPIRKSQALKFVLENTRIRCDKRDIFPAICSIDRPLNKTLIDAWKKEVFYEIIPEIGAKRDELESRGISTIWPDYDHSVPVWDRLLPLGFTGILREMNEAWENHRNNGSLTEKENAFFEGMDITYRAIISFIGRLAEICESDKMKKSLETLKAGAPETYYDVLMIIFLYFIISEHIEGLQARSLSNMDRLLYPYYLKDLKRGVTEQELREDTAYFYMQFTAIGNYWGQPMYLGGTKANGESEINELSYMLLDVYDKMGIYNPKIQIKIAVNTPKEFVLKALDMIRRGHNSIVFVCEETMIKALMKRGATYDQARMCHVTGCYEYSCQGALGTGMNYTNLMKPLEYALYGGLDAYTKEESGLKTPMQFDSFEDFYNAYKLQLTHLMDTIIATNNGFENYLSYINPQSMLSATFPTCLEKKRDALNGGALFNSTTLEIGFLANAADSLTAIKELVFDKKELTLDELRHILDVNYEGYEHIRQRILRNCDHYGNNKDVPDTFATEIVDFVVDYLKDKKNASERNGTWGTSTHVARMSYTQGLCTAASADGRLRGQELSKNLSASLGMSREGVTGAILSATKIDATNIRCDAALDFAIHPTAVQGEDGLEAMYALLRTFMNRGGHAIHINVFDADTLRDAQRHPEKYEDLQIRVCGWNVLWNNIAPEEQEGFILQAEALI